MKDIKDYIRVTDVLFPLSGLKNIDPYILKNAADRGTKVHEICEAIVNDIGFLDDPMERKLNGYIQSFKQWLPKKFIEKPQRFFCNKYGITGECDGVYEDENGYVLIDIKTPVNESKTWRLQGSAYSYLAKKAGYNITRIEFIKLSKDGNIPKIYTYEEDFEMFLKCLDVYKYFFNKPVQENPLDYI